MKHKAIFKKILILTSIMVILVLAWYFTGKYYTPSITLSEGTSITEEQNNKIISLEQGYYNEHLPIFTRKITILQSSDDSILWRVDYFPFGYIERSYNKEPDGTWMFNIEKPLR